MRIVIGLLALLAYTTAEAQTRIDLSTQSRHVDFSEALSTRPFKIGSALPSVYTTGDMFFHTNASPTNVIYACTATNTWVLQSSGSQLNISEGEIGILTRTSDGLVSRTLAAGTGLAIGDGNGQTGNPRISADIASQAESEAGVASGKLMTPERTAQAFAAWSPIPALTGNSGKVLTNNGTTTSWTRAPALGCTGTQTLANGSATIAADSQHICVSPSSSLTLISAPTIVDGVDGQIAIITNEHASNSVTLQDESLLASTNLKLGGTNVTLAPKESMTLVFDNALSLWVPLVKASTGGGGVADPGSSGIMKRTTANVSVVAVPDTDYPSVASVTAKLDKPSGSTTALLKVDGSNNSSRATAGVDFSAPGTSETTSGGRTFTGSIDSSGASATKPMKSGATLPGTCTVGEFFFHTSATTGQQIKACTAANTWTLQGDGNTSSTAGTGIVIASNIISADVASQSEAEAGSSATKVMTPQRTAQAFAAWSPIPTLAGNSGKFLTNNGTTTSWTRTPAFGCTNTQTLASALAMIAADSQHICVSPSSTLILASLPTIADGVDGQIAIITNEHASNSVTLQDESLLASTNLKLGGTNVTLAPKESVALIFDQALSIWVLLTKPGGSGSSVTYVNDDHTTYPVVAHSAGNNLAHGWSQPYPAYPAPESSWSSGRNFPTLNYFAGQLAFYNYMVPTAWPSGTPVTVRLTAWLTTGCSPGDAVTMKVSSSALSAGMPYGFDSDNGADPSYGTESDVVFTYTSAGFYISSPVTVTTTQWSAGNPVILRLRRPSDSFTCEVSLYSMTVSGRKALQ